VSGDAYLLLLHPFHDVLVLTPADLIGIWATRILSGGTPRSGLQ
jgi:hypothetical protein